MANEKKMESIDQQPKQIPNIIGFPVNSDRKIV